MESHNSTHVTAASVKMHVVVELNNGNLKGELSCKYFEEPFKFSSFINMIDMMETTFDAKGFPEKHMLPRTFGASKPRIRKHHVDVQTLVTEYSQKYEKAGNAAGSADISDEAASQKTAAKVCTFDISVRFRHNAEWQGSIYWVEKDVTKPFSSIIELIRLMDNALTE